MSGRRYAVGLAIAAAVSVVAATLWALIPPGGLTAAVAAAAPPPQSGSLPWLHTQGGQIVDREGRHVLLRGFNDDALLDYPWRQPPPLDESDAALMERAGFDVVRLPVSWSRIEPRRGVIDSSYLDRLAAAVALFERHRIYTVLDMHFLPGWGEAFYAPSAPAWADVPVFPNVDWLRIDPFGKDTNPAEAAAEVHFWSAPDWQADFLLAWRSVARRLAGDPGLAGYDLYNEPHPFPIPPRLFEHWYMWPLYARTIAAIGQVDPQHLFFVESTLFGNTATAIVPLRAPNLVYSPHLYTAGLVPAVLSPGPRPLHDAVLGRTREAQLLPAALWFGELGVQHSSPGATAWADTALDELDAADLGWAWWQWRQDGGWGIRSESGASLDLGFLRHLARPYVSGAPAGVSAAAADGLRGRLDLAVGSRGGAITFSVSWPALTLPPPAVTSSCPAARSTYDAALATLTISIAAGPACGLRLRAE